MEVLFQVFFLQASPHREPQDLLRVQQIPIYCDTLTSSQVPLFDEVEGATS